MVQVVRGGRRKDHARGNYTGLPTLAGQLPQARTTILRRAAACEVVFSRVSPCCVHFASALVLCFLLLLFCLLEALKVGGGPLIPRFEAIVTWLCERCTASRSCTARQTRADSSCERLNTRPSIVLYPPALPSLSNTEPRTDCPTSILRRGFSDPLNSLPRLYPIRRPAFAGSHNPPPDTLEHTTNRNNTGACSVVLSNQQRRAQSGAAVPLQPWPSSRS